MSDHPFKEVVAKAQVLISEGFYLYQKFTCSNCQNRLTIGKPNTFYKSGQCDKCGHITDIEAQGCNYILSTTRLPGT